MKVRYSIVTISAVLICAGVVLAADSQVALARSDATTTAEAGTKTTVARGLVVIGCRKYAYGRSRCYASRRKHPEVKMFYLFEGPKPKPGRIVDVRGVKRGALIDTTVQPGAAANGRVRLRGYARSTKVVGLARSYNRKRRTLEYFVSLWSFCDRRAYYCMAQGAFKARVPRSLAAKARAATEAWAHPSNKVWLMTLEFNRGKSMQLASIEAVKDSRRRR